MTIADLLVLNEKFQKGAVQLSELMPSSGLTEATAMIIRSARGLHTNLERTLSVQSEIKFGSAIEKVEEDMDEIIFILDQLDIANKDQQIRLISDFLKDGYDLLSIYSACVDQIIKEKVSKED